MMHVASPSFGRAARAVTFSTARYPSAPAQTEVSVAKAVAASNQSLMKKLVAPFVLGAALLAPGNATASLPSTGSTAVLASFGPGHPAHPGNPANPASPFHHSRRGSIRSLSDGEKKTLDWVMGGFVVGTIATIAGTIGWAIADARKQKKED